MNNVFIRNIIFLFKTSLFKTSWKLYPSKEFKFRMKYLDSNLNMCKLST